LVGDVRPTTGAMICCLLSEPCAAVDRGIGTRSSTPPPRSALHPTRPPPGPPGRSPEVARGATAMPRTSRATGKTSSPTRWRALRVGSRGGVRGGRGPDADLGILGLPSQVDVHDVIRGVVDVHGVSRDEVALRAAWSRPSSLGRIVAPVIQRGPTRGKGAPLGQPQAATSGAPHHSPVQAPGFGSSDTRTVRLQHPVEGLGVLRARRQPHAMTLGAHTSEQAVMERSCRNDRISTPAHAPAYPHHRLA
jgi:hypothetical protein